MLKILVIDDHEQSLAITKLLLTSFGYEVTTAINGADALTKMGKDTPDLIISDVLMPVMDGFALCRELKKNDRLKSIPLIFISSTFMDQTDCEFGLSLGAEAFIIRAQDADEFMHDLREAIQKCMDVDHVAPIPETFESDYQKGYNQAFNRKLQQKITELEDTNRRLKESEERFRVLFEQANDVIFVHDLKGHFHAVNPKACESLGYTETELLNLMVSDIDPNFTVKEDEKEVFANLPITYEGRYRKKDGTTFPVEIRLNKVVLRERILILAFATDVTEVKKAAQEKKEVELQLQQAQKLEAVGTLAGGIAHDFNNILSSIIGYSELIRMEIAEQGLTIKDHISSVIKAGLRAKDLVHHILEFSRHSDIVKRPQRVVPLIKETIKFLKASLPASIEIRAQFKETRAQIVCDATQIHQVVMNLCTNAAHAMKAKGGTLEVCLDECTLSKSDMNRCPALIPGTYLCFTVSDTGHGIPAGLIERVFDPFFTTKERGEGTGLGLSVVHGIIKDMQGEIEVESELGKGTTFRVALPIYTGKSEPGIHSQAQELTKGKGRILVVDDEESIIKVSSILLKKMGYNVSVATVASEALKMFASSPDAFDVVITDLSMPKMNGIELSKRLLNIRPDLPIIMCTGFSEKVESDTFQAIGIHTLLMKPTIFSELAEAVKRAINPTPPDKQ